VGILSPAGAVLRDRFQAAVLRGKGAERAILHFNRRTNLCGETEDAFLAFMFRFMRCYWASRWHLARSA
jgi:propanediol dehydratase small subunit